MRTRRVRVRSWYAAGAGLLVAGLLAACTSSARPDQPAHRHQDKTTSVNEVPGGPTGHYVVPAGIHKIKHVIIDHAGEPVVRQLLRHLPRRGRHPDDATGCRRCACRTRPAAAPGPTTTPPTSTAAARTARPTRWPTSNGGKMDGFIRQRDAAPGVLPASRRPGLRRDRARPDVMGYHTAAEIPNYWTYAKNFVLQDHMFEPVKSWSLPDHLYMVSAWSAKCTEPLADELRQRHRRAPTGSTSSSRPCDRS